ncbi:MAG TPA: MaoC/PaaZ C-terminal domain-containing protein [Ramlibacter sp.]|uniref:MaoC/PaaZ C-terminal domain-containing protein n=1 Tax=Ramlibacter sp. TaxID=1917967 RepID=UPI002BF3EA53|nr:MaoC/PaaZ C-terminal domain-containing protein [Ramlibacter sp.]HVZ46557.1 MaoC/PaaZ C-terminal domain-containing protein [Ramlibacter sp.]
MKELNISLPALTSEHLVRFAGAVLDFNPIHYDDQFARAAGLPGVIAQGPLTYLVTLDALVAAYGAAGISSLAVRLKAPVLPGAALQLQATADGKLSLRAGDGEALAGSYATAEGRQP